MGSKNEPGKFDCYANALPDEPMFVLLARDPDFERLVKEWAVRRQYAILCGDRPDSDHDLVCEALECGIRGSQWRKENMGKWRVPSSSGDGSTP
jgi:hypothetical protein